MAWIDKVDAPPQPHPCSRPDSQTEQFLSGSIWRCDDCGTLWTFQGRVQGLASDQGSSYDVWERTPARAGQTHG